MNKGNRKFLLIVLVPVFAQVFVFMLLPIFGTGAISIKYQHHIIGKPANNARMFFGKRGSRCANRVLQPLFVEADYIQVTFNQVSTAFLYNFVFSLFQTIQ